MRLSLIAEASVEEYKCRKCGEEILINWYNHPHAPDRCPGCNSAFPWAGMDALYSNIDKNKIKNQSLKQEPASREIQDCPSCGRPTDSSELISYGRCESCWSMVNQTPTNSSSVQVIKTRQRPKPTKDYGREDDIKGRDIEITRRIAGRHKN